MSISLFSLTIQICTTFFLLATLHLCSADYTNKWSIRVDGGWSKAERVASKHGFKLVDEVVPGIYEILHHKVKRISHQPSHLHHQLLSSEDDVLWHEQQHSLQRQKRDYFTDPDWPKQWYMNGGTSDMRVLGVYDKYRITGRGVVVTILDDGIEFNHTDLFPNYDPQASYDFNSNDSDPTPRYEFTNFNRHGTRCAGEVSSVANNSKCGVGIAYNSKIGGIRILDGRVTDTLEARSLYFHNQHIDLYSASWGPSDNGALLEGPGRVTQKALHLGVTKGRGGLGSIFVWASGNGGRKYDNCNCDGYSSNVFTISISSAGRKGDVPRYNEMCPSTLATTYSSGSKDEADVVTTDLYNKCTEGHTGTSASAPMAAGIFALALEANPLLTWRDMKHLVVMTSHKANLQAPDWSKNAVGRYVSHNFGYGLLDAEEMVRTAQDWVRVPEQVISVVEAEFEPVSIAENSNVTIDLTVLEARRSNLTLDLYRFHQRKKSINISVDVMDPQPQPISNKKVRFLEHVQAIVSMSSSNRGQVEIFITSPQGTVSQLLTVRKRDKAETGIKEWPFTTVHSWGERSEGLWKLTVACHNCRGTLTKWSLVLYGTEEDPLKRLTYPPRKLKASEKTCGEAEFYLEDYCHKRCPPKYFPSIGLLSIVPEHNFVHRDNDSSDRNYNNINDSNNNDNNINYNKRNIRTTNKIIIDNTINNHTINKSTSPSNQHSTHRHPTTHPITNIPFTGEFNSDALMQEGEEILKVPICLPCHPSCLRCTGSNDDQCLTCIGGLSLNMNRQCVPYNAYKTFLKKNAIVIIIAASLSLIVFILIIIFLTTVHYNRLDSHEYSPLKSEEEETQLTEG